MPTIFKTKHTVKLAIAAVLLFHVGVAGALTVSPAKEELTGDKGEVLSKTFLLINEQNQDQTYYTSVENFDSQGETGTPNFTTSKEGLPVWIKVAEKVTIKKGERVSIPYTITIPSDADAGGHFAAIFLSTVPPATGEGQVSVGAKVGMLILLKVTGDVKEEGGLLSFTLKDTSKKILSSLPVSFLYRFSNTGNDRVKPEGDIVIKNMFGMEVARVNANQSTGNVLPNSVRRYEVTYGENKAPDISAPFFDHVKYQKDNFAFGLYTANLSLTFGNKGATEKTLSYIMFPWQLTVVVVVGVLLVIILLLTLLKRYNRWIIKQARAQTK